MRKPNINRIKKQLDDIEEECMDSMQKQTKLAELREQYDKIEDKESKEAFSIFWQMVKIEGKTLADIVREAAAYEQEHAENNPEIA